MVVINVKTRTMSAQDFECGYVRCADGVFTDIGDMSDYREVPGEEVIDGAGLTLYPGFIDTDMTHGATKMESYINSVIGKIPLGRYGNVDDCANAVLYLASDASSFMNGQHLVIDGGELA